MVKKNKDNSIVSIRVTLFAIFILFLFVIHTNLRINDLGAAYTGNTELGAYKQIYLSYTPKYLLAEDYEEVCNEWEDIEKYKVIENSEDYCRVICDIHEDFNDWVCCFESCIDTKPYIHFYNESVCTQTILVKK